MSEDKLTKDDLVLLMESYRNMIVMHQTILAQSAKTVDLLDNIATKQDSLFSKQSSICKSLGDMGDDIKGVTTKVTDMDKNINSHEKKSIEFYGKIINKIHLGWIGMITIILSLMGLGVTLMNQVSNIVK
jgi:hypothetical protein